MKEHPQDPAVNCVGKDKHANKAAAAEVAKRMSRRDRGRVSEYKCPHCGFYHVGESNQKGKQNGRNKY